MIGFDTEVRENSLEVFFRPEAGLFPSIPVPLDAKKAFCL
jgi:hypothetical protein